MFSYKTILPARIKIYISGIFQLETMTVCWNYMLLNYIVYFLHVRNGSMNTKCRSQKQSNINKTLN